MDTSSDDVPDASGFLDFSKVAKRRVYRLCTVHITQLFTSDYYEYVPAERGDSTWHHRENQPMLDVYKEADLIHAAYRREEAFFLVTYFPMDMTFLLPFEELFVRHLRGCAKLVENMLGKIGTTKERLSLQIDTSKYFEDAARWMSVLKHVSEKRVKTWITRPLGLKKTHYPKDDEEMQTLNYITSLMCLYATLFKFVIPVLDGMKGTHTVVESMRELSKFMFIRQGLVRTEYNTVSYDYVPFSFTKNFVANVAYRIYNREGKLSRQPLSDVYPFVDETEFKLIHASHDLLKPLVGSTVYSQGYAIDFMAAKVTNITVPPYPSFMRLSQACDPFMYMGSSVKWEMFFNNTIVENLLIYVVDTLAKFLRIFVETMEQIGDRKSPEWTLSDKIYVALEMMLAGFHHDPTHLQSLITFLKINQSQFEISKNDNNIIFNIRCRNIQKGPYITPTTAAQGLFRSTFFDGEPPVSEMGFPKNYTDIRERRLLNLSINCVGAHPYFARYSVLSPYMPCYEFPMNTSSEDNITDYEANRLVLQHTVNLFWEHAMGIPESASVHGEQNIQTIDYMNSKTHFRLNKRFEGHASPKFGGLFPEFFEAFNDELESLKTDRLRVNLHYTSIHEESGDVLVDFEYQNMHQYEKNLWLSAARSDPPILGVRYAANQPPLF